MDNPLRPEGQQLVPLAELVAGLDVDGAGDCAVPVVGVSLDSRAVKPGWLYFALPGTATHGAQWATQAVEAGAVAVLTDRAGAQLIGDVSVPVLVAEDARVTMAEVSARFFGRPSLKMAMFGVTGTNGKTTTVAMLQSAFRANNQLAGTIGTIGFRLDREELRSSRSTVTTPEAPDLQALLAVMQQRGAAAVALEVSSHALALHRVDAITFDVVGFLNLGRDHLDFHSDLDDYFAAKARLFNEKLARKAVVWLDQPWGQRLVEKIRSEARLEVVTVGPDPEADYWLHSYESVSPLGGRAVVERGGEQIELSLSLPGYYNMVDAAVAFAMAELAGVPASAIVQGLASAQVPGRMERVWLEPDGPAVIVDFAHTPQAVEAALDSLTEFERIVTVLGCGGDRDKQKRYAMGAAAASRSDLTIITDDNPRTEDPAVIRAETLAGAVAERRADGVVQEVGDRRKAIEAALLQADAHTVVAILGKGHERTQTLADRVIAFDDVEEVKKAWLGRHSEGTHDA